MSGVQIRRFCCRVVSPTRSASKVLMLNQTVPASWMPQAHQSIRPGCQASRRRQGRPPAGPAALMDWTYWR